MTFLITVTQIYLYTVSKQISTTNKKEWLKEHLKKTKSSLFTNIRVTWLKLLGSKFFYYPKKTRALSQSWTNRLVKDRSRKSGSIQERSSTKLAPELNLNSDFWSYHIINIFVKRHRQSYRGADLRLELRLTNFAAHKLINYSLATLRYHCVSLSTFGLARKWSDFHSTKLNF